MKDKTFEGKKKEYCRKCDCFELRKYCNGYCGEIVALIRSDQERKTRDDIAERIEKLTIISGDGESEKYYKSEVLSIVREWK